MGPMRGPMVLTDRRCYGGITHPAAMNYMGTRRSPYSDGPMELWVCDDCATHDWDMHWPVWPGRRTAPPIWGSPYLES